VKERSSCALCQKGLGAATLLRITTPALVRPEGDCKTLTLTSQKMAKAEHKCLAFALQSVPLLHLVMMSRIGARMFPDADPLPRYATRGEL
jgi:hypothetical protein